MRLSVLALSLACALAPGLAPGLATAGYYDHRGPVEGTIGSFFHYRTQPPPVGGDCDRIAAAIGPASTWYGEFAGRRRELNDRKFRPYSARGCFESEFQCRIWQQQAISYADGAIVFTSCRRGVRHGY